MGKEKPGCLLALLKWLQTPPAAADYPYRLNEPLLTKAEISFFHVLRSVADAELAISVKVRLADVIAVRRGDKEWQSFYNKISSKHLDFLLCEVGTMRPVLAIELDDSSHRASRRRQRDEFVEKALEAAGLPLLRVPVRRAYAPQEVAESLKGALAGHTAGDANDVFDAD